MTARTSHCGRLWYHRAPCQEDLALHTAFMHACLIGCVMESLTVQPRFTEAELSSSNQDTIPHKQSACLQQSLVVCDVETTQQQQHIFETSSCQFASQSGLQREGMGVGLVLYADLPAAGPSVCTVMVARRSL